MKQFDLLTMGELLLRLSPEVNERIVSGNMFEKHVGGAELNVAAGVSLMGLRTGVISKLPANEVGTYVKNEVRFRGVSDDWLVYDDSPVWYTTACTAPSTRLPWRIFLRSSLARPVAFIPRGLPWHCPSRPETQRSR